MLTVHRLLGDAEPAGDLLPGPSQRPRVVDLEHLQPFHKYPKRRHRAQPNLRVVAGSALSEFQRLLHVRQLKLTGGTCQHMLTMPGMDARLLGPGRSVRGDLPCRRNSQPPQSTLGSQGTRCGLTPRDRRSTPARRASPPIGAPGVLDSQVGEAYRKIVLLSRDHPIAWSPAARHTAG